ncbi:Uma2 family endonuclease [Streptomyces sp. NPDC018947]|uniref:Uma2 family endonuclease n=1 Tax=Streptomyces sp. NPDC018947 TaxID=3365054 RepID=UPI003791CB91
MALPEDSTQRIELVGGRLMMSPAPGLAHQRASHWLHNLLEKGCRGRWLRCRDLRGDQRHRPGRAAHPNLTVVDAAAAEEAGATVSAPDVLAVVEVASPSTRVTDRKLKPALYAAAGIEHYWRVELEPAPRFVAGRRQGGSYTGREFLAGAIARIEDPFSLDFDPATLVRR